MGIDTIFKIGAIGIIVATLSQILNKSGRDEQATFIVLAGVIVVMTIIVGMLSDLFNEVRTIFNFF